MSKNNWSENINSPQPLLVDFSHENEPDISVTSRPLQATISEVWGQYPHKPKCQVEWDENISELANKIADINPYIQHKRPGEEITAIEAIIPRTAIKQITAVQQQQE